MKLKCSPVFLAIAAILAATALPLPASADNKSGLGIGFVQMQKLWNGLVEKRMTTCRWRPARR